MATKRRIRKPKAVSTAEEYLSQTRFQAENKAKGLGQSATLSCLRCDESFESPDRVAIRVCSGCKGSSVWKEGSMNDNDLYMGRNNLPVSLSPSPQSTDGGKAHRTEFSRNFLNTPNAQAARKKFKERN